MKNFLKYSLLSLAACCTIGVGAGVVVKRNIVESKIKKNIEFLQGLEYKIHSANSGIGDVEVVLLGEVHCETEGMISKIMGKYAKERDIILIEGYSKGEDISHLLKDCDSAANIDKRIAMYEGADMKLKAHFYSEKNPELYDIRDKKVSVIGADCVARCVMGKDMMGRFWKLKKSINDGQALDIHKEWVRSLGESILEINREREKDYFIKVIEENVEQGRLFFVLGKHHVTYPLKNGERVERVIDYLKKKNIRYVALVPSKKYPITIEECIQYYSSDEPDIKKYKLKKK